MPRLHKAHAAALHSTPERNPEIEATADAAALAATEQRLDASTAASARSITAELEERLAAKEAEIARLTKQFVEGNYDSLAVDHPFEVTVQASPEAGGMIPVKIGVNGETWVLPREIPTRVPKFVLEVLQRCKYDSWEKHVNPATGNPEVVRVVYSRFPHTARPLYN